MTVRTLAVLVLALTACSSGRSGGSSGVTGVDNGNGNGTSQGPSPPSNPAPGGPNEDTDGDGYTPAQGDCDDSNPLVGPGSVEINGNGIDDDCDGSIDNAAPCDTSSIGQNTPAALAQAIGICATKFVTSTETVGPSDPAARATVPSFGVVQKLEGAGMAFISNGDATTQAGYTPDPGTSFPKSNTYMSPYGNGVALPPKSSCGSAPAGTANDYTELAVDLTIPDNVKSFSFQFQFFSAEYPEFVCTEYNDRFLVIVDDGTTKQNVAFDSANNTISVDSGFFTVCENWALNSNTQHCTTPVTAIAGTGYDVDDPIVGNKIGGSTGWLTTTVPVTPKQKLKLSFIVYDEGDHRLDSSVLIDNFQWLAAAATAPVTTPVK
jgi:hypothetical protein